MASQTLTEVLSSAAVVTQWVAIPKLELVGQELQTFCFGFASKESPSAFRCLYYWVFPVFFLVNTHFGTFHLTSNFLGLNYIFGP
jgi:hypothetical protein